MTPSSNSPSAASLCGAPGTLASYSEPLLDGDAGTVQTVGWIRDAVQAGLENPAIRARALTIARGCRPNDYAGQVRAAYQWIVGHIRFVNDPPGHELVQSADFTLRYGGGDCDCITTLICALVGGLGIDSELVTVANNPDEPDVFRHIYPRAILPDGTTIAIDAARELETGQASYGLEPAHWSRKRIWSLDPEAPAPGYVDLDCPLPTSANAGMAAFGLGVFSLRARRTLASLGRTGAMRSRVRMAGMGDDAGDILGANPGSDTVYDPAAGITYTYDAAGNAVSYIGTPDTSYTNLQTGQTVNIGGGPGVAAGGGSVVTPQLLSAITAAGNAAAVALKAANSPYYSAVPGYPGYQVNAAGQVIGPNGQLLSASGSIFGTLSPSAIGIGIVGLAFVLVLSGKK